MASLCYTVSGRINAGVSGLGSESTDDVSDLRYLAFGASKTWGSGLENRFDAYPYLLSSKATNLALRATGPNYPSICTQTMVGDEKYDVIMLEYFERANDGLKPLAERLRKRFPNAIMILVQLWHPKMILYKSNGKIITMLEWLKENGFGDMAPELINGSQLKKALEATSSEDWGFNFDKLNNGMSILEDIANTVNGVLLKGPPFQIESYKDVDEKTLMLSTMKMFAGDWFHLSEDGHREVAQAVKVILKNNPIKRSDEVGTWGTGDLCYKWYETGKVDIAFSDAVVKNFKPGKYALQFPSTGGSLRITNPFKEPRSLMISYMTTGPDTTIYPKTEVKINNSQSQPVIIKPVCNDYEFPVHVSGSENVGMVQPGENIVSINPLETKEQPFRVVAAAIINGDEKISDNFIFDN